MDCWVMSAHGNWHWNTLCSQIVDPVSPEGLDLRVRYYEDISCGRTLDKEACLPKTPENDTRIPMTSGLTNEANTAFGAYAATNWPIPV